MSGFIVGLLLLAPTVRGDIPVHCVQAKTIGLWRFHIGSMATDGTLSDGNCGFAAPDPPDGHQDLTPPVRDPTKKELGEYWLTSSFKEEFTMDVALKDWTAQVLKVPVPEAQSQLGNLQGEWTMVYDEAFHVSMQAPQGSEAHSFFAFMKYAISKADKANATTTDTAVATKHSFCDMTLLGWYKTLDSRSKAVKSQQCFWGERISDLKAVPATAFPPPALPVPVDAPKDAKLRQKGNQKGDQKGAPPSAGEFPWKGLLQFVFCLSAASTVVSSAMTIQNVCSPEGKPPKGAGCLQSRSVSIFSLALGLIGTGVTAYLLAGPAAVESKTMPVMTVEEMAKRTQAGLRDAQLKGHPVRWQSDPAKLSEWVNERKQKHGIDVSETSQAQKLIDAFSPALSVDVPGFGTSETIGPVRAKAIEEQKSIAKDLGKDPKDLVTDDIAHLGSGNRNHHSERTFTLDGQTLGPDDWKTLKHFDWRQVALRYNGEELKGFVNVVPDQGNCGSCYATGATSMLTSRLILRYPELRKQWDTTQGLDRISVNQHLRCNPYVQGCDGGYPYLISKWGMENELYTDRCLEAAGENTRSGQCPTLDAPECTNYRFRVMNYRYVGGAFGRCGMYHLCEAAIREELYKGGPLVASIEPNKRFWGYTGGILHEVPVFLDGMLKEIHTGQDVEDCKTTECFIWRKVDHSTLLVAWGEDTSQGLTCQPVSPKSAETDHSQEPPCEQAKSEAACLKVGKACKWQGFQYWVTQNSYGSKWGNDGYMYVGPRGWDPIRIEAMAIAADIEWIREGVEEASLLMANHSSSTSRKARRNAKGTSRMFKATPPEAQ